MKKGLILFISFIMVVGIFTGCSNSTPIEVKATESESQEVDPVAGFT